MTEQNGDLATFLARENFSGTLGKPGQPSAFRPNEKHIEYWDAVEASGTGKAASAKFSKTNPAVRKSIPFISATHL